MPATNPYEGWFDAVATALRTCVGAASQVQWWADEATDDIAPSEKLLALLSRPKPHILLSWGCGGLDSRSLGGFNAHNESVKFSIRFGAGAPQGGGDYERSLTVVDANYTGAFELYHLIMTAVLAVEVAGWQIPASMTNAVTLPIDKDGRIMVRMDWSIERTRETA